MSKKIEVIANQMQWFFILHHSLQTKKHRHKKHTQIICGIIITSTIVNSPATVRMIHTVTANLHCLLL